MPRKLPTFTLSRADLDQAVGEWVAHRHPEWEDRQAAVTFHVAYTTVGSGQPTVTASVEILPKGDPRGKGRRRRAG